MRSCAFGSAPALAAVLALAAAAPVRADWNFCGSTHVHNRCKEEAWTLEFIGFKDDGNGRMAVGLPPQDGAAKARILEMSSTLDWGTVQPAGSPARYRSLRFEPDGSSATLLMDLQGCTEPVVGTFVLKSARENFSFEYRLDPADALAMTSGSVRIRLADDRKTLYLEDAGKAEAETREEKKSAEAGAGKSPAAAGTTSAAS